MKVPGGIAGIAKDGTSIGDLMRSRRAAPLYGRAQELAALHRLLASGGPVVAYVHGPAGIGKTSLLARYAEELGAERVAVAWIDGGTIEPQPGALDEAVAIALASGKRRRRAESQVVVIIDDIDALRLVQTWLRRSLIPALPSHVRIVLAGRSPPAVAWAIDFGQLLLPVALAPLDRDTVTSAALAVGLAEPDAALVWDASLGHPVGLQIALGVAQQGSASLAVSSEALAGAMLAGESARTRELVEAAAILRRATRPLLAALVAEHRPEDLSAFAALPFVALESDGYAVAEPIRRVVVSRLAATDPDRHAALRRMAVTHITGALKDASPRERWRWMADLLYLVEEPQVRGAFFPSGEASQAVEPAGASDIDAILGIVECRSGAAEREVIAAWASALPHRFSVTRAADGTVSAFYVYARHTDPLDELATRDWLLASWRSHLAGEPVGGEALFVRELLARSDWEDRPERIACMLDLKRAYFERWHLSRIYTIANEGTLASPVMRRLGFVPLHGQDGLAHSMVLDLPGDGLVGWVTALIGLPLSSVQDSEENRGLRFVRDRREVVAGGRTLILTRLEAEVLAALIEAAPEVVSREAMVESIWRRTVVGSNVVDAVVRTLRRKLGPDGSRIVAVPKAGYRYRG